jgi:structural maintenance of chromosome 3 (chondroitin sulfate proteoglycan 6)
MILIALGSNLAGPAGPPAAQLDAAGEERRAATASAHDAKRALDAAEKACRDLGEQAEALERALYLNMPQALRRGLDEIKGVSDASSAEHIAGIHGPLYDLFKPKHERYNTAVEAVAGPDLFNVVVDDEHVAARVMKHLAAKKAGRVTCVPLARVKLPNVPYPQAEDCRPLASFLEYDPAFSKAVLQTFSRALLCRSTAVAAACLGTRLVVW